MKTGKKIYRLLPRNYWRILELENWLGDMARKGLFLQSIGTNIATFSKKAPRNMRYKVDLAAIGRHTDEQLTEYGDNGWEYIDEYGDFSVFAADEDDYLGELYTSKDYQKITRNLKYKLLMNFLLGILYLFISIVIVIISSDIIKLPILSLVENFTVTGFVGGIIYFLVVCHHLKQFYLISKLRRKLKNNNFLNHSVHYKGILKIDLLLDGLIIFFVIIVLITTMYSGERDQYINLPDNNDALPFVSLEEIERDTHLAKIHGNSEDGVLDGSRYKRYNSIVATNIYTVKEYSVAMERTFVTGGSYKPSLKINFYELKYDQLALGLVSDLIKDNSKIYDREIEKSVFVDGLFTDCSNSFFDEVYVHTDDLKKQIAVSKEHIVCYIKYYGEEDAQHIINKLEEKLVGYYDL